ncbi:MAG: riboflavin biosynthesis protein RibF [Deltaproteobacteria bacterium]|nr:riboflavin biosynthesis protein RibF [Deltaproteobacteria bacterium]
MHDRKRHGDHPQRKRFSPLLQKTRFNHRKFRRGASGPSAHLSAGPGKGRGDRGRIDRLHLPPPSGRSPGPRSEAPPDYPPQGIDVAILASFSRDYARQTPEEFVRSTLYDQIQIRHLFVGHDFTFGKNREGDIELLKNLGRKFGFNVEVVEAVRMEGKVVSSTLIRDYIQKGEMAEAAKLLGRHYQMGGKVIHGHGRGSKKLGFPTANLKPEGEGILIPKSGIYAVWSTLGGKRYSSVANLGWNPTFQDQKFSIEVHIMNFDEDLYGQAVQVEFVERLRDEVTFSGPEELIAQIKKDVGQAKKILKADSGGGLL